MIRTLLVAVSAVFMAISGVQPSPGVATAMSHLRSADASTRITAVCSLKQAGRDAVPAIPVLVDVLADSSPVDQGVCEPGAWNRSKQAERSSIGREAALALAAIGVAALEPLTDALRHQNRFTREHAAVGLGALDDRRAVGPLDPRPRRHRARRAPRDGMGPWSARRPRGRGTPDADGA